MRVLFARRAAAAAAALPSLAIAGPAPTAEGASGATPFIFTVTRSGSTTVAVSCNWAVTGSGANPANAADFQGGVLPSGTLSFAAGQTVKTITVNVAGDTAIEPDEQFTVTLSAAVGALLTTAAATATILNDDATAATWKLGASRGDIAFGVGGTSNANAQRIQSRTRHVMGRATYDAIKLVDNGYYISTANVETAIGNARTIQRAIEISGAPTPVVRLKWSGANSVSVASGATWVETDPVYPSDFGLTSFASGTVIWLRIISDVNVGENVPQNMTTGTGTPSGEGAVRSATTNDQLMSSGALVTTGTGSPVAYGQAAAIPFAILGRSAAHDIGVTLIGDSIAWGTGDDVGDGSAGAGFAKRALYAVGCPWTNLARPTTQIVQYLTNSAGRALIYPYASHGLVEYPTNDLAAAGRTAAQALGDLQTLYGTLHTAGIRHIEQTTTIPRVTSSDSFATVANQTPVAHFFNTDSAGRKDFNTALIASVGSNYLDAYIDTSATVQDATSTDKWQTAKVSDGTHPNQTGHAAMQAPAQTRIATWS